MIVSGFLSAATSLERVSHRRRIEFTPMSGLSPFGYVLVTAGGIYSTGESVPLDVWITSEHR